MRQITPVYWTTTTCPSLTAGPEPLISTRVAQPLVVTGLARQVGEQVAQVLAGEPQPAGLADVPEQGLEHRQGNCLGVAELGADADRRSPRRPSWLHLQPVIDSDVQCGREGVCVGVHVGLRARRLGGGPPAGFLAGHDGVPGGSLPGR